jgi:dTDP-4-dehydrorhamnose 3,5-epimerase-like enzyme
VSCCNVQNLKVKKIPHFPDVNGGLVVVEGGVNMPFMISRVFIVRAPDGAVRGQHAHRECSQFLICPSGVVEVLCDDGEQTKSFVLDHPNVGLLIPPGIWSRQTYKGTHVSLTVLCDRRYEASDYIRDYDLFLDFRNKQI